MYLHRFPRVRSTKIGTVGKQKNSAANSEKVHLIKRHCSEFGVCGSTLLTTAVGTLHTRAVGVIVK